ncbi:hypothetical protein [Oleiharenicola lentus]|uniref:hypothetical protein n=1 Tax=Oleiharenicola lentus TaxID=2508720 RepID=UPI003F676C11
MSRLRQSLLLAAVLAALVGGVAWIFLMRVSGGEMCPAYSSLRADALGSRVLHDALQEIPGVTVARDFRPVARWRDLGRSVVIISGAEWQQWESIPENKLKALNKAAADGARIVITFQASELANDVDGRSSEEKAIDEKNKNAEEKRKQAAKKKKSAPGRREIASKKISEEWGVTFKRQFLFDKKAPLAASDDAVLSAPVGLGWRSDLYFSLPKESPWKTLYTRSVLPVLIEKKVGTGSLVMMAESYPLSNEALQNDRATQLFAWMLGDYRRVIFVESELGVLEENGVGSLARRYGLGGALAVLLLLAVLYGWRRLVEFVPRNLEERAANEIALAHEPTAGMTSLLRRSIKPKQLLAACVEEWRKSKLKGGRLRPADERLDGAWSENNTADQKNLSTAYNALVKARQPR